MFSIYVCVMYVYVYSSVYRIVVIDEPRGMYVGACEGIPQLCSVLLFQVYSSDQL